MSINKTRGFLYGLSRLLGDVNAVKKGTVGKRIVRRAAGKHRFKTKNGLLRLPSFHEWR
ncbi:MULTISPECIES: hypothetical protein [Bacillus]|uniref:hypothetical protein n=1 Tax=Bacillus TaxID=1386 RepID=UPI001382DD15|nr:MULTISPECIES: hypothetical protein [Bacillus]MBY8831952.1 hypothetical protein [Bacillus licheniformis]MCC2134117.1 hypothetical protein [Bacillus licheniformis]MCC2146453.1 hypothetical protein [Bacillus licheniformis]MCC2161918.1 hypothetical protein [Bacillus licheniformis]MCC2187627.1 hypothetical protein [Bacillus licheniformis]